MTSSESIAVLSRNGYFAYMGPGYSTDQAIQSFMTQHPRGKGIKGHRTDLRELYQACLVYRQAKSRTKSYKGN